MSGAVDLPIKEGNEFMPEYEKMSFQGVKDATFAVAVSTGDRSSAKGLNSTLHGPYSFVEMVDLVHRIWTEKAVHAKPYIISKDFSVKTKWLDRNTVDYIEVHGPDIATQVAMEELLGSDDFTCKANAVEEKEDTKDGEKAQQTENQA